MYEAIWNRTCPGLIRRANQSTGEVEKENRAGLSGKSRTTKLSDPMAAAQGKNKRENRLQARTSCAPPSALCPESAVPLPVPCGPELAVPPSSTLCQLCPSQCPVP